MDMSETTEIPAVDGKAFWRTLGERATGVTIVTAGSEEGPVGFLGLSASHVTADPPTMLVSIDAKTSALKGVLANGHFAINFIPAGHAALVDLFSGKGGVSGAERFAAGDWETLATGAPVYKAALGVFDCAVEDIIQRGTISIVIGRVKATRARGEGEPLVFFRGKLQGA
jgi:flavin reductase (DIM6/NTAB) family NADH-FMN oxidoreductase RutF